MEIWKTIKETDGKYAVSNLGNVKRLEHYTIVGPNKIHYNEKFVKQYINKEGYCIVSLRTNTKQITRKVHTLVATEFIDNPNNYSLINHIDENKTNNCVNNLEWCDAKHNANHGTRNERLRKTSGIKVAQYSSQGHLIKIWDSMVQASQSFGCKTTCCIKRVCKGERKTYRGFIWKYVDRKTIGESDLKSQMLNNKNMLIDIIINNFSKEEIINIYDNYGQSRKKDAKEE